MRGPAALATLIFASSLCLLLIAQLLAGAAAPEYDRDLTAGQLPIQRRVALVIGNGAYQFSPLKNPVNDADDIADTLSRLGFKTILRKNAKRRDIVRAINKFGRELKTADVGLFYYAGHGMQVNGRNYLIPIGANLETESDVEFEAVDAGRILGKMDDAETKINIVILDACRNNPFAGRFRTASRGLAGMDAPEGSFIAFATAPGSVAADGEGRNGIFTKHLLLNMIIPGLKIEEMMKNTRNGVLAETEQKQIPWDSSCLTGDFYFVIKGTIEIHPAPPMASIPAPPRPPEETPKYDDVLKIWEKRKEKWNEWQMRMVQEYFNAELIDGHSSQTPDQKIRVWTAFLSAFSDNNPFSDQDEIIRQKAQEKLTFWRHSLGANLSSRIRELHEKYEDPPKDLFALFLEKEKEINRKTTHGLLDEVQTELAEIEDGLDEAETLLKKRADIKKTIDRVYPSRVYRKITAAINDLMILGDETLTKHEWEETRIIYEKASRILQPLTAIEKRLKALMIGDGLPGDDFYLLFEETCGEIAAFIKSGLIGEANKNLENIEESLKEAANVVEKRRRLSQMMAALEGQPGLSTETSNLKALMLKGDNALSQHQMEMALEEYKLASLGFQDLVEKQRKQANNAFKAHRYEKALELVNRAIMLDSGEVDNFKLRGAIFAFQKKFDLALLDYNKVVEREPTKAMSYYGRGIIQLRLEKYQQSIDDFNKSIKINPGNANAYVYRGIAHKLMKNYHSACLDFAEACALGSCREFESGKKEGICQPITSARP